MALLKALRHLVTLFIGLSSQGLVMFIVLVNLVLVLRRTTLLINPRRTKAG